MWLLLVCEGLVTMIIASLTGGLGNQLFQYAAARALAYKHGTQLKIDTFALDHKDPLREYSLNNFRINAMRATTRDILRLDKTEGVLRILKSLSNNIHSALSVVLHRTGGLRLITRYYEHELEAPLPPLLVKRVASQRIFDFDEDFFSLPDDIILIGTWVSYKYFEHIRPILLNELSLIHEMDSKNAEIAENIKNTQSVSVHVRRTDKINDEVHPATDLKYIRLAMDYFNNLLTEPIFYFFSDDITWCKLNIKNKNSVFVELNDGSQAYEDLRLMSFCKHNIIAESTFSWWGAYLNINQGNIIISPPAKRWANRINSSCKDILPSEWKILE